jgi:hypothetical protein
MFTVDEPVDWIGYSLDDQINETISGNTTLLSLPDGMHHVVVCANNTYGNMAESTAYFAVDTIAPEMTSIAQIPLFDNVLPTDEVRVNATITDSSGVRQVTLNYTWTNNAGTWNQTVTMTNVEGNVWNATILAFPYDTNVTYSIVAEDNAGNTVTSEELGYECQYQVIPEFSSFPVLMLFMIATVLALIVCQRKHRQTSD